MPDFKYEADLKEALQTAVVELKRQLQINIQVCAEMYKLGATVHPKDDPDITRGLATVKAVSKYLLDPTYYPAS